MTIVPMHIAYCLARFPCPSETFLRREMEGLRARGIRVTVLALRGETSHSKPNSGIGEVIYRPGWLSTTTWRALAWMLSHRLRGCVRLGTLIMRTALVSTPLACGLLRNLPAVTLFAHEVVRRKVGLVHGGFLNMPGLIARAVADVAGRPYTVAGHARDIFVEGQAAGLLAERAEAVICCHASACRELASRLPVASLGKLRLNHHGLDIDRWAMRPGAPVYTDHMEPVVVGVGRLVEKKGFDVLIRSCATLLREGLSIRLVLIGAGPMKNTLRELADREGLNGEVTFTGWQEPPALRRILAEAEVCIVPSIQAGDGDRDGIPNVLLEAAALGVPVVASDLPGLNEVIVDEVTGLLVAPSDVRRLAGAIRRMLSDPSLAHRLAAAGRDVIERRFNARVNTDRLIALFEDVYADVNA